jgi:hypothetical protein
MRIVKRKDGKRYLLVRHGGGDEAHCMGYRSAVIDAALAHDSNERYWLLLSVYHALRDAADAAAVKERGVWTQAARNKRIKTRKVRGSDRVKVWIESGPLPQSIPG